MADKPTDEAEYMTIPTESYAAIFDKYSAAIKWMRGLGIQLTSGRILHYEKIIGHWKDAYKTATERDGLEIFPDFVSAMLEIPDFVNIYQAFESVPAHRLTSIIEKLQAAVNGPINAADEMHNSTAPRNFLFEAAVAAKAHRPDKGVEAILNARSDTGISLNGKKLWIECKRVTAARKIERNVQKASSQLETILAKEIGSGHRGIVALDVSKILNRGDKILVTGNDKALLSSVNREMDEFIHEHSHLWEKVYSRRNKKVIGTIIRFSFMASSEASNILVHASQWAMNPRLGVAASDEAIQRQLVATLSTSI